MAWSDRVYRLPLTVLAAAVACVTAASIAVAAPSAPAAGSGYAGIGAGTTRDGTSYQPPADDFANPLGLDVSGHQGNVNWADVRNKGAQFAYVKATEGTTFRNPYFAQQYNGSYNVGLIRGAYHFALPNVSGAVEQADHFVNNGGGWSGDGMTMPPALDIEYNPYGATCYGLSQGSMVNWIRAFSDHVRWRTGRYPIIYTTTNWWVQCTGNNGGFGQTNPLWLARYADSPGTLPNGWGFHTIWQFNDRGTFPGDQNVFNGSYDRLKHFATY